MKRFAGFIIMLCIMGQLFIGSYESYASGMAVLMVDTPINHPPTLSGPFDYSTRPFQTACITITTRDSDANDTTRIIWDKKLPNATFSTTNGIDKHAKATLCWTPMDDEASCLPYYFTMTVYDDNKVKSDSTTKLYAIKVIPLTKAKREYKKISCHTYQFKSSPVSKTDCLNRPYIVNWFKPQLIGIGSSNVLIGTTDSIRYDFRESGQYIIRNRIESAGNTEVYHDTLLVLDYFSTVDIMNNDSVINANDSVELFANTTFNPLPEKYEWWANGKRIDTTASVRVHPAVTTTYTLINKALSEPCDIVSDNVTLHIIGSVGMKRAGMPDATQINNPINNQLIISNDGFLRIQLFSLEGKQVLEAPLAEGKNIINTESIAAGIYIAELSNNTLRTRVKLIKN